VKVNWSALAHIGNAVVTKIIPAIGLVESCASQWKNLTGQDKEDIVIAAVRAELALIGKVHGIDLSTDPDVLKAARGIVQAVHAFHEIVATKAAAAGAVV
jgi:hypothetical protein